MRNKFILLTALCFFQFSGESIAQQNKSLQTNSISNQISSIKPAEDGISFLVIGDFGRHGAFTQKDVARDMGNVAELLDLNFTISVGDNFYPSGVQSIQDYQWISSYESVYTNHLLHEPWYVALGNHDYEGNSQAQIDYTSISRRWEMPARYFEKLIKIDKDNYLQLLVIDTNPFIEKYKKEPNKYLGINEQNSQEQLDWIHQKLASNNEQIKWRIVVGHHPMYTGGKRVNDKETTNIKLIFEPIFAKYKVDAYLTGHEHDLQVIKKPKQHLFQFLSGAGSELRETGKTEGTLFAESVPGFMAFTLNRDTLTAYVIQSKTENFDLIYETKISK